MWNATSTGKNISNSHSKATYPPLPHMKLSKLFKLIRKRTSLSVKRVLRREILVIGDSHAGVFNAPAFRTNFKRTFFNVVDVGGATVSGLTNPNSQTQALPIFLDAIQKSKAPITIVLLGEVDTGFVIWHRAEKYKASISEMLKQAAQNYQDLLFKLSDKSQIICISANTCFDQTWLVNSRPS